MNKTDVRYGAEHLKLIRSTIRAAFPLPVGSRLEAHPVMRWRQARHLVDLRNSRVLSEIHWFASLRGKEPLKRTLKLAAFRSKNRVDLESSWGIPL